MSFLSALLLAIAGGVIPAFVWLWFWLREDRRHPEPTGRLVAAFGAGIAVVVAVIPLEYAARVTIDNTALLLLIWAIIEEGAKLLAVYFVALRTRAFNHPIDAPIYLITTALGFAAIENLFFLLGPFQDGAILQGLLQSNYRFLGATLVHVLSSAAIGVCVALVYYKRRWKRIVAGFAGLCIAVLLHWTFNYLIIQATGTGVLATFLLIWIAVIVLLVLFERIKSYTRLHYAA